MPEMLDAAEDKGLITNISDNRHKRLMPEMPNAPCKAAASRCLFAF
jgi:hypothetical protein